MIDWTSIEAALADLTDAETYRKRLLELQGLATSAEAKMVAATKLQERYDAASALHTDGLAALAKAREQQVELDRRQDAIAAAEREVAAKQKAVDEREAAVRQRELLAERRHQHLSEIAKRAAE